MITLSTTTNDLLHYHDTNSSIDKTLHATPHQTLTQTYRANLSSQWSTSHLPIIIIIFLRHGILPRQQGLRKPTRQAWRRRRAPANIRSIRAVKAHARIALLQRGRFSAGGGPFRGGLGRRRFASRCSARRRGRSPRRDDGRRRWWGLFFDVGGRDPGLLTGFFGEPPTCLGRLVICTR